MADESSISALDENESNPISTDASNGIKEHASKGTPDQPIWHVVVDKNNYYSYKKFKPKLRHGLISRLANQAWARFFFEMEKHAAAVKMQESGLPVDAVNRALGDIDG